MKFAMPHRHVRIEVRRSMAFGPDGSAPPWVVESYGPRGQTVAYRDTLREAAAIALGNLRNALLYGDCDPVEPHIGKDILPPEDRL